MKKFTSILFFTLTSFLSLPHLAFADTYAIEATDTFKTNGITLELFDINSTEYTIDVKDKRLITATTEFVIYQLEDSIRGKIDFVWEVASQNSYPLNSLLGVDDKVYKDITSFNDQIYFITSNAKTQHCAVWQLQQQKAIRLADEISCGEVTNQLDSSLYISDKTCDVEAPLLTKVDLSDGQVDVIMTVANFTSTSLENTAQYECPHIKEIAYFQSRLFFAINAYDYTWQVWQYNLTDKKLADEKLLESRLEGYISIFSAESLYIVEKEVFGGYNFTVLNSGMQLSERKVLGAYNNYPFGYDIEPFGIFNSKFTYIEETALWKEPAKLIQFAEDGITKELIASFDLSESARLKFLHNTVYFEPTGNHQENPLYSLDSTYQPIELIPHIEKVPVKNYHVVNYEIYYMDEYSKLWLFDTQHLENSVFNLPSYSTTHTLGSAPRSFIHYQGRVYFVANNEDNLSASIWYFDPATNTVEKLINPGLGPSMYFSDADSVSLSLTRGLLLINYFEGSHQWVSYSATKEKFVEHAKIEGFAEPIVSYGETNYLHFKKDEFFWQYDPEIQHLESLTVNGVVEQPEYHIENSESKITYLYFDERFFAFTQGRHDPNSVGDYLSDEYAEFWMLTPTDANKLFSTIDQEMGGELLSVLQCVDIAQCITEHKGALHIIDLRWHIQLKKGANSVELTTYEVDTRYMIGTDTSMRSISYNDTLYSVRSCGDERLYYFDEAVNKLKAIALPREVLSNNLHFVASDVGLYFLDENNLWLLAANKADITLAASLPVNTGGDTFELLDYAVLGDQLYWQQSYINDEISIGKELAVLSLYQHAPVISGVPEVIISSQTSYTFTPEASDA